MERIIYLDNAATTRPFAELKNIYNLQAEIFYNPSAIYALGINEHRKIENARNTISNLIGGEHGKIIFTSGATEANNLALSCVNYNGGGELVVSCGEHPSIFEKAKQLDGIYKNVKYIELNTIGKVNKEQFENQITDKTALISVMMVSNETGAINDIKELCKIAKRKNPKVLFHTDCVQAFGKIEIDALDLGIDMLTISAHKLHGPKGVGALWVKNGISVKPILFGGGQEGGYRSGTENVAGILAFEYAAKKSIEDMHKNLLIVKDYQQKLINSFNENGMQYINNSQDAIPYITSISIDGLRGEVLTHILEKHNIFVSTGSACSSKKPDNRTLISMGRTVSQIQGTIRISLSPYDEYDYKEIGKIISQEAKNLLQKIKGNK